MAVIFGFAFPAVIALMNRFRFIGKDAAAILVFVVLFFFVSTLNGGISRDHIVYVDVFSAMMSSNFQLEFFTFYEPAFFVFPFIAKTFFATKWGWLAFTFILFAALGLGVKLKACTHSDSFYLSLILYCSSFLYLHEMTQIRIGVASGIFLVALRDLCTNRPRHYLIKIFIALFFHYSSALYFLVFLVWKLPIPLKWYVYALLVSLLIAVSGFDIMAALGLSGLTQKTELYVELVEKGDTIALNLFNYQLLFSMLFIGLVLWRTRRQTLTPKYELYFKIHLVSVILFYAFSMGAIFAMRFYEAFAVVQILLFPGLAVLKGFEFRGTLIVFAYAAMNLVNFLVINYPFEAPYSSWLF